MYYINYRIHRYIIFNNLVVISYKENTNYMNIITHELLK